MVLVLKATQEQYDTLNGYEFGAARLEFVKDADDNWVVGLAVLTDLSFSEIHDQLDALERIDFNPVQEDDLGPE